MKFVPSEMSNFVAPDGHTITEVIGLTATNSSRYSVARIIAPAGSRGQPRQNQFDEVLIIESGRGIVVQDHVRDEVGPQDVVMLPAGTRYWMEVGPEEDVAFWALCVPAYRPEWSQTSETKRDWRDYQTPRGADRLRPS